MKIFSFKGRAIRSQWWGITIPLCVISKILDIIPEDAYENIFVCIGVIIVWIIVIWLSLAVNTRRCHDLGHNGFWQFIPFYNIWLGFVRGKDKENKYGPAYSGFYDTNPI